MALVFAVMHVYHLIFFFLICFDKLDGRVDDTSVFLALCAFLTGASVLAYIVTLEEFCCLVTCICKIIRRQFVFSPDLILCG